MKEGESRPPVGAGGGENTGDASESSRVATGLPIALQVARRLARRTRLLDLSELESVARCALSELLPEYEPERGSWKSFVAARVGFALFKALRKERRLKTVELELKLKLGLDPIAAMEPCSNPLDGDDFSAYERLVDLTAEAAFHMALHLSAESEETQRLVRHALSVLPSLQRDVVERHFLQGKSFRQIANELGCSLGRVRRAFERAQPALRRGLRGAR